MPFSTMAETESATDSSLSEVVESCWSAQSSRVVMA